MATDVELIGDFVAKYTEYILPVTIDKQLDVSQFVKDVATLNRNLVSIYLKEILGEFEREAKERGFM